MFCSEVHPPSARTLSDLPKKEKPVGSSPDSSGNTEGYHSRPDSPVAILADEAKSVAEEIFEALSRCTATFRLYASSSGPAFGFFYSLFTSRSAYWRTYRIRSTDCSHISQSSIDADREADGEHSSTFRIKHLSEFLYDSGESVINLEHVRNLLADPPAFVPGPVGAFADFSAGGDESVFSICRGNSAEIVDAWRHKDTMSNVGRFIVNFQKHNIRGFECGGECRRNGRCDAGSPYGKWVPLEIRPQRRTSSTQRKLCRLRCGGVGYDCTALRAQTNPLAGRRTARSAINLAATAV